MGARPGIREDSYEFVVLDTIQQRKQRMQRMRCPRLSTRDVGHLKTAVRCNFYPVLSRRSLYVLAFECEPSSNDFSVFAQLKFFETENTYRNNIVV